MPANRPGRKSMSRYAWIAPVIVALAFGLVYLFGDSGPNHIKTLEVTGHYERVRIDQPVQHGELQSSKALSADTRQRVLQRLSGFRAEHRMLGPAVTVTTLKASAASIELAQRIGELLAQHNLGNYTADPRITGDTHGVDSDGVILSVRRADRTMAHDLVSALSPMLAGTVRIRLDDTHQPGKLLLEIAATPGFSDQGVAVFPAVE